MRSGALPKGHPTLEGITHKAFQPATGTRQQAVATTRYLRAYLLLPLNLPWIEMALTGARWTAPAP